MSNNNQKHPRNETVYKIGFGFAYPVAFCAGYTVRILNKAGTFVMRRVGKGHKNEGGQTVIEYAIIIALFSIVAVFTLTFVGDFIRDLLDG